MNKIYYILPLMFVFGCMGTNTKMDKNGKFEHTVRCSDMKGCKNKASILCPNGFLVKNSKENTYMSIGNVDIGDSKMTIVCE